MDSLPSKHPLPSPSVVLHIPHSATRIPATVRDRLTISEPEIAAELLAMTDWFTDELFATTRPAARIVFPVSRLVVDPERFTDDAAEVMAARGMGVIYTKTSQGAVLRDSPTSAERAQMLTDYYTPHHKLLTDVVNRALMVHGKCLVIDCHSFASKPLPYELDQDDDRPDICPGTDDVHTPSALFAHVSSIFTSSGYSVAKDRPFSGALVPALHYRTNPNVESIMIELNRGLYMNEAEGTRNAGFARLGDRLGQFLDRLVDATMAS